MFGALWNMKYTGVFSSWTASINKQEWKKFKDFKVARRVWQQQYNERMYCLLLPTQTLVPQASQVLKGKRFQMNWPTRPWLKSAVRNLLNVIYSNIITVPGSTRDLPTLMFTKMPEGLSCPLELSASCVCGCALTKKYSQLVLCSFQLITFPTFCSFSTSGHSGLFTVALHSFVCVCVL